MRKRARPKQHMRRLKSGKKILVNKGVKKTIKRRRSVTSRLVDDRLSKEFTKTAMPPYSSSRINDQRERILKGKRSVYDRDILNRNISTRIFLKNNIIKNPNVRKLAQKFQSNMSEEEKDKAFSQISAAREENKIKLKLLTEKAKKETEDEFDNFKTPTVFNPDILERMRLNKQEKIYDEIDAKEESYEQSQKKRNKSSYVRKTINDKESNHLFGLDK